MADENTLLIAADVRRTNAGQALTGRQAKLYSQRLRRDTGQEGLATFVEGDVAVALDEAMLLLECGLLERSVDPSSGWRASVKRAAELLEWLSQDSLRPTGAPLHLMSAAAYQMAGYPAMALGHLRHVPADEPVSAMLREFLRANFPAALEATRQYWRDVRVQPAGYRAEAVDLTVQAVEHVIMCVGNVCAYLRTGGDVPVERALVKLDKLATGFLHSRDPYSYLLARLTAASGRRFVETCLWPHIGRLREASSASAAAALNQFARSAFVNRRALVWPAQAAGIERLRENSSFVLCTPTGSGKTTVATLATVQALFEDDDPDDVFANIGFGNIVLYLVPSRALAAEVEARLADDLRGVAAEPVVVTGLYGGIDWGPTDAWVQTDRSTIVICTFEKADALIRYLGVLFLDRVRLVVVDEAHMVEHDENRSAGIADGTSRSLRLEVLGARLLRARDRYGFRILALSAVAARAAPALARWISSDPDAQPTASAYRSTRQMLGRLQVSERGQFEIHYDLMDGHSLKFEDERRDDTPYVRAPFPPLPAPLEGGVEVRMRAPTLWAALHLAAERPDGSKPSVLISLTQNVDGFAGTAADLMDAWEEEEERLPNYRTDANEDDAWVRCLASAEDYFTADSVEYRLLSKGIAVHHGRMPALLARRLKVAIDRGYVRVIIATSTLSEGVNIPVNFLLIPSVYRGQERLSLQEFTNLIGRAGRPGTATEGSALVVLPEPVRERDRYGRMRWAYSRQQNGYDDLVREIEETAAAAGQGDPEDDASSPLAQLLEMLESAWQDLTGEDDPEEFARWLEETAVADLDDENEEERAALNLIDSLDAFLIAAIEEVEELRGEALADNDLEAELTQIWRRTYAFAAAEEEARLESVWLSRGKVVKVQYPDAAHRRKIYKTSLPPRAADRLLESADVIRAKLNEGAAYVDWGTEQRLAFIGEVLALLSEIPTFRIGTRLGRARSFREWRKLLRWWLAKGTLAAQPRPNEIANWYDFVANNFIYRGAWGLGSLIGILLDSGEDGEPIRALEIADWPRSGLPWIAFWLKELINWGTLDPVAAFLLARGDAIDRPTAEADAQAYYEGLEEGADPNDVLDPRVIRDWVEARRPRPARAPAARNFGLDAVLARNPDDYRQQRITVSPLEGAEGLLWVDPAGYFVARSNRPREWPENPSQFDFELAVAHGSISGEAYLRHVER
jgi:superfamily II DNA/RNA helicase